MIVPKWFVLAGFMLTLAEGFSENSVYLKSPNYINKLVTSSTLRWITAEKGNHPETAVVGTVERVLNESAKGKADDDSESDGIFERNVYICRASRSGIWIPGQLRVGTQGCLTSLHDSVRSYEKYEVLENTDGGARLSWVRWDKFNEVPVSAVAGGETFVARKPIKKDGDKSLGLKHLIGKLDDRSTFGKLTVITEDEKEEEFNDGEVLIEIEPVRYELTGIQFNHIKKTVTPTPVILGEAILSNNQNQSGQIDTMIGYDSNTSVYWGQVKAMLKGLQTIIRSSPESSVLEPIEWGITHRDTFKMLRKVEAFLEPNTAVNVTLKGIHTEIETPYTARLIAVYSDGANRARQIHGNRAEVQLQNVTPEFSPVYFMGNFSLVPTTTTTTTTTTTSTTKATTTQETTESSTNNVITKDISTNEIDKEENPKVNVMNDQGSNEKAASTQDSSGAPLNNGQIIILSASLLLYRIL